MAGQTKIEWTDATWNPVRGCTCCSPGCARCYARLLAARFSGPGQRYAGFAQMTPDGPRWTGKVALVEHMLRVPMHWRKPCMVFVNSMSDLFHEDLPVDVIDAVAGAMCQAHWHTYLVLTKRSERLRELLEARLHEPAQAPHIWWGMSVQDRRHGLPRIDHLRAAPARRRFLSVEPLLEDLGTICLDNIDWVIVGGESGPGARPMEPAWVRDIREQCRAATVPFFLKQSGTLKNHPDRTDPTAKQNGGNAKGGRMLDGRTWDEMPALTAPDLPERHSTTARPSTTSADSRIAARNQPGRLLSAPEAQS